MGWWLIGSLAALVLLLVAAWVWVYVSSGRQD